MAWPPPALPINRTSATPQQDVHPADHNQINQAMNDAVTKIAAMDSTIDGVWNNTVALDTKITTETNNRVAADNALSARLKRHGVSASSRDYMYLTAGTTYNVTKMSEQVDTDNYFTDPGDVQYAAFTVPAGLGGVYAINASASGPVLNAICTLNIWVYNRARIPGLVHIPIGMQYGTANAVTNLAAGASVYLEIVNRHTVSNQPWTFSIDMYLVGEL